MIFALLCFIFEAAFAEQARQNSSSNMMSPLARLLRRKTEVEISPTIGSLSSYITNVTLKDNSSMIIPKHNKLFAEIRDRKSNAPNIVASAADVVPTADVVKVPVYL